MDIDACDVCEKAVDFVDEKLQDPDTIPNFDSMLEEICLILPQNVRSDVSVN